MITPFTLPSNPAIKIQLREETVADAIEFADVNEAHEEKLTTLFLNRMQEKAAFVDSLTWTAEDRRFGLFWYWQETSTDLMVPLSYQCDACGEKHTFLSDFRAIVDAYQPIRGLAERDAEWNGERIIVHPLRGADVEALEDLNLALDFAREKNGEGSGVYRKRLALVRVERLLRSFDASPDPAAATKQTMSDPKKIYLEKRNRVLALSVNRFEQLSVIVGECLEDLSHGLETEERGGRVCLIAQPHRCPNREEVMTRVRVPFRCHDYVAGL